MKNDSDTLPFSFTGRGPGCDETEMQQFGYGSSQKLLKGAAYQFQCEDGAIMIGSPTVFCDGRKWNDTAPTCISKCTNTWCQINHF